ncbi:FAD-binding protein, partial [Chloroflexota bacterium]
AKKGIDPDFQRGESYYDQSWGGDPNFKNPCLAPLETAPYYCIELWGGNIGTAGGLRVNANSQVLTPFNSVISRLYSAGNNAGIGGPGVHYGGGGGTVGPAMVFGYIAGKHAANLTSWT